MTEEVLNCLQGERSGDCDPSGLRPPPLAGEAEAAEAESAAQAESDTLSAPAGQLPLKGKAGEGVPDARMLREHLARLQGQAAQIPGFDLNDALRDPAFVRLTAPGMGVSAADAWYALHREELEHRREEESRALLARAAAALRMPKA